MIWFHFKELRKAAVKMKEENRYAIEAILEGMGFGRGDEEDRGKGLLHRMVVEKVEAGN